MSNSRSIRNNINPLDKSKSGVFHRLGYSRSNSHIKTDTCPSLEKYGVCKNEANCKYYHHKSDVEISKLKVDDSDKKIYKEDSKIRSAVIVGGKNYCDNKSKFIDEKDKSKKDHLPKLVQHSDSKSKHYKNSDQNKSDHQESKNMLDLDNSKMNVAIDRDEQNYKKIKTTTNLKDSRTKTNTHHDDKNYKIERRSYSRKRRHRQDSNSSYSSSSGSSSSDSNDDDDDDDGLSSESSSSDDRRSNSDKSSKKKKLVSNSSTSVHLNKLSAGSTIEMSCKNLSRTIKNDSLPKTKSSERRDPIRSELSSNHNKGIKDNNSLMKNNENKKSSISDKSGSLKIKLQSNLSTKTIDDKSVIVCDKNETSNTKLHAQTNYNKEVSMNHLNDEKINIKEKKSDSVKKMKSSSDSSKLENKSQTDIVVSETAKNVAKNVEKNSTKIEEGSSSTKLDVGGFKMTKPEGKIVMKMLKPLTKMKKDVNKLAAEDLKKSNQIKKEPTTSKSTENTKSILSILKDEDLKNLEGDNNNAKRKPEKTNTNYESRTHDDHKMEHSKSSAIVESKDNLKRTGSSEYSNYSESKRTRHVKYEHERSSDICPPIIDQYSPQRLRSHSRKREDDRHSDVDNNAGGKSSHRYDDRYGSSHRKFDSRARRSTSVTKWDYRRSMDTSAIGGSSRCGGAEIDDRYYEIKRTSGGGGGPVYDQRLYKDTILSSYDRGHERLYDRGEMPRDQWNRSYEHRPYDENTDLMKEAWDDKYRKSDQYKGRSDWDKGGQLDSRNRRDILLPPPPRIRSSSNLVIDSGVHIENTDHPTDQDQGIDRTKAKLLEMSMQPKDDDANDVNDILGTTDPKEDLKTEVESLPSRIPIVDILDIKWKSLATGGSNQVVSSSTSIIKHWQPMAILSKIGVSRQLAGEELFERVRLACQKEESDCDNDSVKIELKNQNGGKFNFLSDIAFLHTNAVKKSLYRQNIISNIGSCRRALCARKDLAIRRTLCKLEKDEFIMFPVQMVDPDIHKQSLQMFQQNREVAFA